MSEKSAESHVASIQKGFEILALAVSRILAAGVVKNPDPFLPARPGATL